MDVVLHCTHEVASGEVFYGPLEDEELSEREVVAILHQIRAVAQQFLIRPHRDWGLSSRASNTLKRHDLLTIWDLQHIPTAKIARLQGCGLRMILEIYQVAADKGIDLPNWLKAVSWQYQQFYDPSAPSKRAVGERELLQ